MIHSNVIILVIVCGACLVPDVQLMKCSIGGPFLRVEQLFQKKDQHQDFPKCTSEDFKQFNDECLRLEVAQKPPPKGFNIDQPATEDSPRGSTAEVVRVKYGEGTNKKPYAVKRISMPWAVNQMKTRDVIATEVCTEMKILQKIEHPFIVKLHWSLWNEKYAVMIFDYYQMGSFYDLIASTGPLSEEKTKFYTAQLVLAIEYLHETKRIVHRDIKCSNILVDNEGYLKVTDFGFSNEDDATPVSDYVGATNYAAPEVFKAGVLCRRNAAYLRKPTDIWSLGVVIYYMLFRKFPYKCNDNSSILRLLLTGVDVPEEHEYMMVGKNIFGKKKLLETENLETREMLQDMLKNDVDDRLTIKQIKDHDSWNTPSAWIKPGSNPPKFDWEALQSRGLKAPLIPSKNFKKYIDTESGYEFKKVVPKEDQL